MTSSEELVKLKKRKKYLDQLIAAVGSRAQNNWLNELKDINEKLETSGSNNTKEIDRQIGNVYNDVKKRTLQRGGILIITLLLIIIGLFSIYQYLASSTDEIPVTTSEDRVVMSVKYPRFIFTGKCFEILVCVRSRLYQTVGVEIEPPSTEFTIEGDQWYQKLNLNGSDRVDWRPKIGYDSNKSWWKSLYKKENINIIGKNLGNPFVYGVITLRVIGFYVPMSMVIVIIYGLVNTIKDRLINIIFSMFKGWLSEK